MTMRSRIFRRQGVSLYIRNALASVVSFLLDLLLIWVMIERMGFDRFVAVAAGFILANAFHYGLARIWVYRGTDRGLASGYLLFLGNALFGLALILAGFAVMTEWLDVPYMIARVLASLCAGTVVFILNATLNFRRL